MNSLRTWVTPLTIGTSIVMIVTGVLMFFHFRFGLNTAAHEWVGILFVIAIALHVFINFKPFKKHLTTATGLSIVAISTLILALSFISWPITETGKNGGLAKQTMNILTTSTIEELAPIAHKTPNEIIASLNMPSATPQSTPMSLAYGRNGIAMQILTDILSSRRNAP